MSKYSPTSSKFSQNSFQSGVESRFLVYVKENYYTPERTSPDFSISTRQTPKSILKASHNSGSKCKKSILIDESLNEIRKISKRGESNDGSPEMPEKTQQIPSKLPQNLDQPNIINKRTQIVPLPVTSSSISKYCDSEGRNSKDKTLYRGNQNIERENFQSSQPRTISKKLDFQVSSPVKDNLSDFHKAEIRRLQREREKEIYDQMLQKSKSSIQSKEDNLNTKNSQSDNQSKINKEQLDRRREKSPSENLENQKLIQKQNELNAITSVSQSRNRFEGKLSEIERSLNSYSEKLKASLEKCQTRPKSKEEKDVAINSDRSVSKLKQNLIPNLENRSLSASQLDETKKGRTKLNGDSKDNLTNNKKTMMENEPYTSKKYGSPLKARLDESWASLKGRLEELRRENELLRLKIKKRIAGNDAEKKKDLDGSDTKLKDKELNRSSESFFKTDLSKKSPKKLTEDKKNENNLTKTLLKTKEKPKQMKENIFNKSNHYIGKSLSSKELKSKGNQPEPGFDKSSKNLKAEGMSSSCTGFHSNQNQPAKNNRKI